MLTTNTIYTAFQTYKNIGLDPLPIPYENGHPTKGPRITGWQSRAVAGDYTEEDFTDHCNIGILLGGPKNLTDIDCDSPQAVAVSGDIMDDVMEKTGKTMIFGHPSKPRSHYIYFTDESLASEEVIDPFDGQHIIEYRCVKQDGERGKQTVFPPSMWFGDHTGEIEEIQLEQDSTPVPAFLSAKKLHERFRIIAAIALLAKHFPVASERHNTILALAGVFARAGMEEQKAVAIVRLAYRHSSGYNGDHNKAEADVRSVYRTISTTPEKPLFGYPKLTEIIPIAVVDRALELIGIEKPATICNLTDAGNGRRLVDKHKNDIRYCVDDHEWYVWDGIRWRKDFSQKIRELAKGIAADIRHEGEAMKPPAPCGDEDRDKEARVRYERRKRELLKWADGSENADRVSKTIRSAESDPRITCSRCDFDRDGSLLNCVNGVVDLRTGTLMAHDRQFMMSNLCPVEYDPNATHKVWDESLAAFTRKHSDLLPFLKTLSGYTIQGEKSEERILILHGPGNAGKGTFMDWLSNALGPDYACAMDAASVLKQNRNSAAASGDIARLEGKRIVVVSEVEKGSRLQESFMKQASGNDSVVARGLYQSEREFRPTHQFWFQTNYRPGFDSTDSGNKRRYIEIPFDNDLNADPLVTFDPKLKIRMRQDKDFLKAVLAWAVTGAVEWYQHGLQIPKSVEAATKALFAHNDFLNDFLSEMCVIVPGEKVPVKQFWNAYERWCEDQGEEPAQGRTFNHMLEERGFIRKQARVYGVSGKAWVGIRLKQHDELMQDLQNDESCHIEFGQTPDLRLKIRQFPTKGNLKAVFTNGVAGR